MVTLPSIQGRNPPSIIFDIQALWRSVPKCQKDLKGSCLDQYGTERFGRLIFGTIRKRVGVKGLIGD